MTASESRGSVARSGAAELALGFLFVVALNAVYFDARIVGINSSTHRTPEVRTWLTQHPRVHFHYTPTSASWLNQVEGFFGILASSVSA